MRPEGAKSRRLREDFYKALTHDAVKRDRDRVWQNLSTLLSLVAFLISLGSLYLLQRQDRIGEASDRYTFWVNITKSMDTQHKLESKIKSAFIAQDIAHYKQFLATKGNSVSCQLMTGMGEKPTPSINNFIQIGQEITGSYNDAVLGNEYLGKSLGIIGWDNFMNSQENVNAWWDTIMVGSGAFDVYTIIDSVDCKSLKKDSTINMPPKTMGQMREVVKHLLSFAQFGTYDINIGPNHLQPPNDQAYALLLAANNTRVKYPLRAN